MKARGDMYPHTISGRFTNEEGTLLAQLRASMPEESWTSALRWIVNDPVCRDRINARIRNEA